MRMTLKLCSALMNTFTTYKQAIVIFRNITLTILTESNGSFYTFDPHARNHDGMPNSNGTATVLNLEIWVNLEHSYVLQQMN